MNTADRPQDGNIALLDEPEVSVDEVIRPTVETRRRDKVTEEVIFPVIETMPPAEKVTVNTDPQSKTEKHVSRTKTVPMLVGLILVMAGIALFLYLQNNPEAMSTPTTSDHTGHTTSTSGETPETAFKISPEKQQLIGVQYGTVEYQAISKSLRAVGKVAYDETKVTRISPKIEGWIEDVYVDFTGKLVQKGQPLLSIYSPDLVQTQQEYLLAIKGKKELSESPFGEAVNFSESLVQSARRRLELWDVSEQQIRELEKRGTPSRAMTIYAPASGFVMTRNAFPKQRVMPDTELYSLADLSTVWIIADIYEFEAADVKLGQNAKVTLSSFPGREFNGKVTYIFPQVDNATRTLKVRIELPNKRYELKADMFADVSLQITYGSKLVVPQEAVMDSGSEQLVYVSLDDGYFEPRKVQIGAKVDDKYIVLGGLQAGERIVTSGNFLIDSESKLKSAASGMSTPGTDHSGHR